MRSSPLRFLLFLFLLGVGGIVLAAGFILIRNNRNQYTITVSESELPIIAASTNPTDLAIGLYLQVQAATINTPTSDSRATIPLTIEPGQSAIAVSQQLQTMGLIRDSRLFQLFLRYNGLDTSIEAGNYELRGNMAMPEIALALQEAIPEEVVITIPEGWRAEQVAEYLTAENIMDGAAFLNLVQTGTAVQHPLLADRPPGQSYEGYLFPDTYRLLVDATPQELLETMLDNMAEKLPANAPQLAQGQGLTFFETLIVASIVEREAVVAEERSTIASVYLNRLSPSSTITRLEADPTVQYAMGYQPQSQQWWKTPVTLEEYQLVDSPYNTYLYPGLPPGPIASPGAASILAVLEPAQTNYLYFVCSNPNCVGGAHVFAETWEEHVANVDRYYGR